MDQKQRNKIAWGLIAVFAPLLIYLLVTNVAKVGKRQSPPAPAAIGAPGTEVVPLAAEVQPPMRPAPAADPKVLAEQKRITALLPKNNPFNPSRPTTADQPPITAIPAAPEPPPVTPAPPTVTDAGIKLTAIVSRQGSAARMAMINGRFYGEGDRIANWAIIKVNPRDIVLQDGTRQMILRLK